MAGPVVIEYECKACGGAMNLFVLTTHPPQHEYVCLSCGRKVVEHGKIKKVRK
jgi:hypothetical protein